ncbi:hypothetical protein DOK_04397 [gamma proteobacterium BDW918]|uniref:Uncharacterized protein n=1 Tax=Zhongshania aliphaticivorans TaxID=1470434 RepID=A0A127M4Y1_9GAMM|nr:hypothetical protein [Zhongshania aliphaticivorans]AMO68216.1 hypothetical protein AZF00_07825 [Zhongshania aliphaticivorans]EIF44329.1 hypothetical protein DOK_04397 [gamma proteobacterium BDW918]
MLSYLELVELANGDVVLQRSEGDENPLVTIRFSEETREHINGSCLEIARAMVQAGIEAVSIAAADEGFADEAEADLDESELQSKIIH